ncbi:MAG: discoidin domain-containing protein, partial [Spirochaetia bacterium]|nr:discoidin domain-containing protein [Spirochaetia bacterium]
KSLSIYVDGKHKKHKKQKTAKDLHPSSTPLGVGDYAQSPGWYVFSGLIDEVRISKIPRTFSSPVATPKAKTTASGNGPKFSTLPTAVQTKFSLAQPRFPKDVRSSPWGLMLNYGASRERSSRWGAENLLDGKPSGENAGWSSFRYDRHTEGKAVEWCQVKLDAVREIDKVVLIPRIGKGTNAVEGIIGFPVDFQILMSEDEASWQVAVEKQNYSASGPREEFGFSPVKARYVRVRATKLSLIPDAESRYYFQLMELEVYRGSSSNFALYKNGGRAVASSSSDNGLQGWDIDRYNSLFVGTGIKWAKTHFAPDSGEEFQFLGQNGFDLFDHLDFDRGTVLAWEKNGKAEPADAVAKKIAAEVIGTFREKMKSIPGYQKVKVLGMENEPNLFWFGDRLPIYVRVVRELSAEIKKNLPGAKCMLGGTALFDYGFLEGCFKEGIGPSVDLLGIHTYSIPGWFPPEDKRGLVVN